MTALVMRSVGRIFPPLIALMVILAGMQVAVIAVAASFEATDQFSRLSELVPAALQGAFDGALSSFGRMITILFFDPLIVITVVLWAVYVGSEPAGEVESGLVDLILARPRPRRDLVTRTVMVMAATTLAVVLAMVAGTLAGLSVLAPDDGDWPPARTLVLLAAQLTLVALCFGAAALAVAGWARRRATAIGSVSLAALTMYLIDFLGQWWLPLDTVALATPFYYFHGGMILTGAANSVRDLTVLASVATAAAALAYWRFERRDV